MTQTDYCSYELSKLLKSAGYPQEYSKHGMSYWVKDPPFHHYDSKDSIVGTMTEGVHPCEFTAAAPSLWDAMKWLRETKKLFVHVSGNMPNSWSWEACKEVPNRWGAKGYEVEYATIDMCGEEMISTYESACDGGIQAACEYLLKKEKQ